MNSFSCVHASNPCACSSWYCSPVFERNETGPFLSLLHQPQITQQSVMGELKLRKKVVRSELFEFLPAQLASLLVPRKAESQPGDVTISDLTAQFSVETWKHPLSFQNMHDRHAEWLGVLELNSQTPASSHLTDDSKVAQQTCSTFLRHKGHLEYLVKVHHHKLNVSDSQAKISKKCLRASGLVHSS